MSKPITAAQYDPHDDPTLTPAEHRALDDRTYLRTVYLEDATVVVEACTAYGLEINHMAVRDNVDAITRCAHRVRRILATE